ncbi:MAG: glycoside hydrolase family 5 protein [Treponema sp.]|jgi:endoglucanase|nr:glycoside hydrolase family 5 protein [Treponema sp.]
MRNKIRVIGALVFAIFILFSGSCEQDISIDRVSGKIRDIPAADLVREMKIGVNIGNTLDSIGTNSWTAGETGWGNPKITQSFIRALKKHGYTTIRLPVTWAEQMGKGPKYTITGSWMDRVEQVVNWILAEDMYCILNLHHDGGGADKSWILKASTRSNEVYTQLDAVWTQIAERFEYAGDRLVFEAMNEVGFDDLWNRYSNQGDKAKAYRLLNSLNQVFVDAVRDTGGNNASRFLLISGYWTDIDMTCDYFFNMPSDTASDKLILSVHYYTPAQFCIAEDPNTSWGFRSDWGNGTNDKSELNQKFNKLKTSFLDNGIPVILGEYGATTVNKVEDGRIRWMTAVTQICLDNDICPVLWDTGNDIKRQSPYAMSNALKAVWNRIK